MHTKWPAEEWIDIGHQAVARAGEILADTTDRMRTTRRIEEKGRETKILADEVLHRAICEALSPAGLPIYSEEGNTSLPDSPAWCWIIDPLDGSANFQRGFSLCAVSIALCQGPRPRAGFVYDLHQRTSICGGAGIPTSPQLQCADTRSLDRAILCTGIPARLEWSPANTALFSSMFRDFYKIRMLGSAVQALLHVATGKADVYFERNIMFWDVAAAWAIAEAAGIAVDTCPGTRPGSLQLLATTPPLRATCRAKLLPSPDHPPL